MKKNDQPPAWLTDVESGPEPLSSSNTQSASHATQDVSSPKSTSISAASPKYKKCVQLTFCVINLGLSIMVSATGALGMKASTSINDSAIVIVGLYLILFSGILVTYEIIQLRPITHIDNILKRNFGFLYGMIGRSMYLIFIGILCFGIPSPSTLATASGIIMILWGVIQCGCGMQFPSYFDKKEKFVP